MSKLVSECGLQLCTPVPRKAQLSLDRNRMFSFLQVGKHMGFAFTHLFLTSGFTTY